MVRTLFLSAVMLLGSSAAAAQITTYVAPPRPLAQSPMVAAADSAQRDSVAQVAMTNMKAWVDSAAGVSVPAHVGDSIPVDTTRRITETFVDGSVAPATASYLPALALFGTLTFAVGAALLRKRPRG